MKQLDSEKVTAWRDALVSPPSRGSHYSTVKSIDGKVSAPVESVYVDYLRQRYPSATVRIRGEFEPIIFVVSGRIRASVMPLKL